MAQRNIRSCPFYQIEFNAVAAGKTIAMSKRHIRWRFGFPNAEAIDSGKTGTACRGVEHEVTVVWSVTSGKRRIMADHQQIHVSVNRSGGLEYSWVMSDNVVIRIVAQSTASSSNGRQYDLFVNGQSYFSVPKVFELGIKGSSAPNNQHYSGQVDNSRGDYQGQDTGRRDYPDQDNAFARPPSNFGQMAPRNSRTGPRITQPATSEQEAAELRTAIADSLKESQEHLNSRTSARNPAPHNTDQNSSFNRPTSAPNGPEVDLLDFNPMPTPQSYPNNAAIVPSGNPAPSQWDQNFGAPPPVPTQHDAQYQQPVGIYGDTVSLPPQPHPDTFAPRGRTYTDISSQVCALSRAVVSFAFLK